MVSMTNKKQRLSVSTWQCLEAPWEEITIYCASNDGYTGWALLLKSPNSKGPNPQTSSSVYMTLYVLCTCYVAVWNGTQVRLLDHLGFWISRLGLLKQWKPMQIFQIVKGSNLNCFWSHEYDNRDTQTVCVTPGRVAPTRTSQDYRSTTKWSWVFR